MSSDYAVWSGYQLDRQSFMDFISVLSDKGSHRRPGADITDFTMTYISWTHRLPRKVASQAPKIRYRTLDGEIVTHVFFPLRWIPYKSRRQINDPTHPDYAAVHEPTDKDKARLENWLKVVNETLDGKCVDKDKFEFSVMKDLHPLVEWRAF